MNEIIVDGMKLRFGWRMTTLSTKYKLQKAPHGHAKAACDDLAASPKLSPLTNARVHWAIVTDALDIGSVW